MVSIIFAIWGLNVVGGVKVSHIWLETNRSLTTSVVWED